MPGNTIPLTELRALYLKGHSMAEIASILHCSSHKVVYWMDKYKLKRRSISEAIYTKLNPHGDPFNIKLKLNKEDMVLYGVGLGLYMGEGEKVTKSAIRVANTDPLVIKLFVHFLQVICQVDVRKIKYSIVCFQDNNVEKVKEFWSKVLKTPQDNFGKIVQIAAQGKGIYRKKSESGVCTVSFHNIKLKTWLMKKIEEMKNMPG